MTAGLALGGCAEARRSPRAAPVYDADLGPLLEERCGGCHGAAVAQAAGAYRVSPYGAAIACSAAHPAQSVVTPADGRAPLVAVIVADSGVHAGVLTDGEATDLLRWVEAGTPLRVGGVHGAEVLRPDAAGFHGELAARDAYAPVWDPEHPWACGRCHGDAPVGAVEGVAPLPGATACSACHDEADAGLECSTCHAQGNGGGQTCFQAPPVDAHAVHLSTAQAAELDVDVAQAGGVAMPCSRCHPINEGAALGGRHGNGRVEVEFSLSGSALAGNYDPDIGRCTSACHGGQVLDWFVEVSTPTGCAELCHGSPPPDHYLGSCTPCHAQVNGDGTGLLPGLLHANGQLDLGQGGQGCGACHGNGQTPWPLDEVHRAHRDSGLTRTVACAACHPVPEAVAAQGHLDIGALADALDAADVVLPAGGQFKAGTCSDVPCHGGREVRWQPVGGLACTACHGLPPPLPHAQTGGCADLRCHGAEVRPAGTSWVITEQGRTLHIDGKDNGNGS